MVSTKLNDEIDLPLQKEIFEIKEVLFEGIIKKDYDKVSKFISPKLSEPRNFDLKSFIDQLSPLLAKNEFVIIDQYFSTLRKFRKESKVRRGGQSLNSE
jgi:hypothetical protein